MIPMELTETFDAAMTEEAWSFLKSAYLAMRADLGEDGEDYSRVPNSLKMPASRGSNPDERVR